MSQSERKESADKILDQVCDYLAKAGWTIDGHTFFHVDPVSEALYPTDTAFCIQLGRDFKK